MQTGKLDALLKRQAGLKEAIATEKVRDQQRKWRMHEREASIIGNALIAYAEKSKEFGSTLKGMLASVELDDASRKFLVERGRL